VRRTAARGVIALFLGVILAVAALPAPGLAAVFQVAATGGVGPVGQRADPPDRYRPSWIVAPASIGAAPPSIIPAPRHLELRDGRFIIGPTTRIVVSDPADSALAGLAEYFAVPLRAASGFRVPVDGRPAAATRTGVIALVLAGRSPPESGPYDWSDHVPENYTLDVSPDRISLTSPSHAGLFRGLQTLRQLLPAAFEDGYYATHGREWRSDEDRVTGAGRAPLIRPDSTPSGSPEPIAPDAWSVPAVHIEDAPRFAWRGMHLDVGRHLFPVAFIRKYIDLLASRGMNVFHWHLTEDQGWRIEIAKYPRLVEVGGYRRETILGRHFDPYIGDGVPYGGFYTQEQIRDIVAYAASRYVTIVPEIEMPGHSVAALAAYPELACTPGPFEVATVWGVSSDIYCPSERTFAFLEDVLTEVMDLFPGRYIHIGGDEAPKTVWQRSDIARQVIRREGLADEHELQSWFIRRIERFLNDNGRRLVGWDEILEGGLAPEAAVMSWRGTDGGIRAAAAGHDVVMTPNSHVYFDYYQGDSANEPLANGSVLPLERVYSFEPVPSQLNGADARHVLGTQGNVWTEYMKTPDHVEYMVFPRLLALAEVAWSPPSERDWHGFLQRLPAALDRLDRLAVDYRVPDVLGLETDRLTIGDTMHVTLDAPVYNAVLHYTVDGSVPTVTSPAYDRPLVLTVDSAGVTVTARAFTRDGRMSTVARATFRKTGLRQPDRTGRSGLYDGLYHDYFEGDYRSADDVRLADPLRSDIVSTIGLRGDEREERFAVRLTGYINAPVDGIYTFTLSSDDGSRLRVGRTLVVDHDGPHGTTTRAGRIALAAGWHLIELTYFQAGGGRSLDLEVALPGQPSRPVPPDLLAHYRSVGRQPDSSSAM